MFSLHLSGKNKINETSLKGKSSFASTSSTFSLDFQKLKGEINSFFIVPLATKQWRILHENMFFLSKFKKKLAKFKSEDTTSYFDMFVMLELLAEEHKQIEDLERRLNSILSTRDQFFTMVYKTKRIKLLPEYEIYDSILGKPLREKGQQYKDEIINLIKSLLERERITFDVIRNKVLSELSSNGDSS